MAIDRMAVGDVWTAAEQNAIADAINNRLLGTATSAGTSTLALTGGTNLYVTPAWVTFNLVVPTRVDIYCEAEFDCSAGAPLSCGLAIGYNPGTTIDTTGTGGTAGATVVQVGHLWRTSIATTTQNDTLVARNTVLLAAGDWTVFGLAERIAGGSASDQVVTSQTIAAQLGFA